VRRIIDATGECAKVVQSSNFSLWPQSGKLKLEL
jgi:hypothetical protein